MTALPEGIDPYEVADAKVLLLTTGRATRTQRLAAYRLLAAAGSPATYLPKLAEELIAGEFAAAAYSERIPAHFAECEEAAAIARGLDMTGQHNVQVVRRVLWVYQHQLYLFGRRAEAFAVREELARAWVEAYEAGIVPYEGTEADLYAVGLAEEGRHDEAAEVFGRSVARERTAHPDGVASRWRLVAWAAELDAAGRRHDAIHVLAEVVARSRQKVALDESPIANFVWESVRLAQLLDQADEHDKASATREEILALLTTLAATGEPNNWSSAVDWWSTLFAWSGRADEPLAAPGAPAPALGVETGWSPDVRQTFRNESTQLAEEVAALAEAVDDDPRRNLPSLVTTVRRILIRSTFNVGNTAPYFARTRSLFDHAVDLARHHYATGAADAPALLARALTDRMTARLAERAQYAEALRDFREACALSA